MKTDMIKNCAKSIDETIPDLTVGMAIDKASKIHDHTQSAFTCATYAVFSAGLAVGEFVGLTVIATKTMTKKAVVKAFDVYSKEVNAIPVVIRR